MKLPIGLLVVVLTAITTCFAETTASPGDDVTSEDAMNYLMQYGYAGASSPDSNLAALMDVDPDEAMRMGLMLFQAKYEAWGLNVTGELDEPTRQLMAMPRCGFKDMFMMEDMPGMEGLATKRRRKRYNVVGNRWPNDIVSWRIINYTPDLNQATVDDDITRAFQVWADVSALSFERRFSGNADILITFARGDHNDGSPFDGRGGVLAHAYFPFRGSPIEGDAHFDEDENWSSATFSGTNLFQVAAHEFGHSLGLGHSEVNDALMAPFYTGYQPDFQLHSDDIAGIQALYGSPDNGMGGGDGMGGIPTTTTTTTTTTTRSPTRIPSNETNPPVVTNPPMTIPPGMPDFCANPRLDAMTAHIENGVLSNYVFQGDFYARLDDVTGIMEGYPRRISDDWSGITGSIDAALYLPAYNEHPPYTLLFKGARYYIYSSDRTYINDRSLRSFDLPADMNGIDSAFVWGRNGRIYVSRGNQYYRLKRRNNNNVNKLLRMNNGYPRDLSVWNLPVDTLDGAHMYPSNGKTYFFKDHLYYRYDDASLEVDQANPPYPRDIGAWWLGCRSAYIDSNTDNKDTSDALMQTSSLFTALFLALFSYIMY